jgi:hypothetical protein
MKYHVPSAKQTPSIPSVTPTPMPALAPDERPEVLAWLEDPVAAADGEVVLADVEDETVLVDVLCAKL